METQQTKKVGLFGTIVFILAMSFAMYWGNYVLALQHNLNFIGNNSLAVQVLFFCINIRVFYALSKKRLRYLAKLANVLLLIGILTLLMNLYFTFASISKAYNIVNEVESTTTISKVDIYDAFESIIEKTVYAEKVPESLNPDMFSAENDRFSSVKFNTAIHNILKVRGYVYSNADYAIGVATGFEATNVVYQVLVWAVLQSIAAFTLIGLVIAQTLGVVIKKRERADLEKMFQEVNTTDWEEEEYPDETEIREDDDKDPEE